MGIPDRVWWIQLFQETSRYDAAERRNILWRHLPSGHDEPDFYRKSNSVDRDSLRLDRTALYVRDRPQWTGLVAGIYCISDYIHYYVPTVCSKIFCISEKGKKVVCDWVICRLFYNLQKLHGNPNKLCHKKRVRNWHLSVVYPL